jgi:hypothetical protein
MRNIIAMMLGVGVFLPQAVGAASVREQMDATWGTFGQRAKTELAKLPDSGRASFQNALIACSLFVDEYLNSKYESECQRAATSYLVEYSDSSSTIPFLFKGIITMTRVYAFNRQLAAGHPIPIEDRNPAVTELEVLQRAYRETRAR